MAGTDLAGQACMPGMHRPFGTLRDPLGLHRTETRGRFWTTVIDALADYAPPTMHPVERPA